MMRRRGVEGSDCCCGVDGAWSCCCCCFANGVLIGWSRTPLRTLSKLERRRLMPFSDASETTLDARSSFRCDGTGEVAEAAAPGAGDSPPVSDSVHWLLTEFPRRLVREGPADGASCTSAASSPGGGGMPFICRQTRIVCTTPAWPLISARSSGVIPFLSGLSATAPQASKSWTTGGWPLAAAKWSGVDPGPS